MVISAAAIAVSIGAIVMRGGLNLGLDFTGGVETHIKFEQAPDIGQIRTALTDVGLGKAVIQRYGPQGDHTVLIRFHLESIAEQVAADIMAYRSEHGGFKSLEELKDVPGIESAGYENLVGVFTVDPEERSQVDINTVSEQTLVSIVRDVVSRQMTANMSKAITNQLGEDQAFEVVSISLIGPKVSQELGRNALLAIIFGLVGMLIYIGIRFQFRFAVGAIVALVHDVLITVGALSLGGYEFSLPIIAALLTIVGYSLNDTIVIYDRIRENTKTLRKKRMPAKRVFNLSINQSLSRTLITSLTTAIVVVVLFVWGGEPLRGFTFALLIGVIVGTYSSEFVATPVVYSWSKRKNA
jgi:preprotein translocase subunit SecF